jgi:ABC-2 type transport system ATP-binding protein
MIEAKHLSKYYSGKKAIDDINFKIEDGEIVGLLGLNGAGKSTILKILGCFLMPSGGRATVFGFNVDEKPEEIRKLIGYLPDSPPLYDEMTVIAYLKYVAALKNVSPLDLTKSVANAVARTSLKEVADAKLGELSHGFRQRVGIAQAIVHDPKLLILDEPINGLDPIQIVEMRDLILSLKGKHTVVLSSHILSEITRTCDRVLIIDKGRLVAEGAEQDLQQTLEKRMTLRFEMDSFDQGIVQKVENLQGVEKVNLNTNGELGKLVVKTTMDVRASVAQTIVGSGAGLLSMHRDEAGLEGVFMKLVRGTEGHPSD